MSKDIINDMVWESIQPMLPLKNSNKRPKATKVANPYITKSVEKGYEITPTGEDFLQEAVSDPKGNVYAFTDKLDPVTIAAAMARLSRRGDDMRITILDEFANAAGKDEKLLHRVITAYGDDSVQQLVGQHVVVENASNLLTKKLEWGRLASYLEQSTRYIYFDQKDQNGNYKYYVPEYLDTELKEIYTTTLDDVFDLYSDMVHKLTDYLKQTTDVPKAEQDIAWQGAIRAQACDAIRPVLPVATKSTVGIFASGQALESLIMHLLSDELPEAQQTGEALLREGRKVLPTFLERADNPERGGAIIGYRTFTKKGVDELASDLLPKGHSNDHEAVTLDSFWPKNELDLIPDMLYEHSDLSLRELQDEVASWPYARKEAVFKAYMGERLNRRHRPGRAIEKAHYSWDLMCDYGIFRDLQRHRMVDDMEWQQLTPRYGYETPPLVEEAGLSEQFERCFDLSYQLYSELQRANYPLEAQYATLLGHKMRWKVTYNAREAFHLHELRTSPQGHPGYRKLVLQMHEKLAEVHPMLAEAMKFVNQGEDPALTRLAAERYTQAKLEALDKQSTPESQNPHISW
jgi:thymidylate synthase ThyX